jgi:SulP family sulfate permease
MAGLIVAVMLVPQAMAYALLAGLPAQTGLYASILPLILYGILGTSRSLAVGPVAIVSILVASGVGAMAAQGTAEYVSLALTLAFMAGLLQVSFGLLKVGFLVNFLSRPVLAGFTSAAGLVIGLSQMKHLLGITVPRLSTIETVKYIIGHAQDLNPATLLIGAGGILTLLFFKLLLGQLLARWQVPRSVAVPLVKSGPLVVVVLGTLLVALLDLDSTAGLQVVGQVPAGLPSITMPILDLPVWQALLPSALAISFISFMESISVAKSLACKRRQKVDSDQELIALGAANIGATFTGGYPVTGGFSRSVVNHEAGAQTGLASMITATLIGVTALLLTPLFYYLPQAILAAIIIVAVSGLVELETFRHVFRYNRADAASMLITFLAVMAIGIETGILVGVAAAMLLFVWRTSRPHVAVVGRLGESEVYRNVLRHEVKTCAKAVVVRIDESLYFANAKYLEDTVLRQVASNPDVEHFVLVGTAVNFIDASALETLESLHTELRDAGVQFHMSAVKGPVLDRLKPVGFLDRLGLQHIHPSTHDAMKSIGCV